MTRTLLEILWWWSCNEGGPLHAQPHLPFFVDLWRSTFQKVPVTYKHGNTVVWWITLFTARRLLVQLPAAAFLCGVYMFSLYLCEFSGFLPQSKNMHASLMGDCILLIGMSVCGCLSTCGPWRPRSTLEKRYLISVEHTWLNKG